jgi:membrane-bound lytic murein transglycosylase
MRLRHWPALALIAVLAACAPTKPPTPPDRLVLRPASFGDLTGWTSDGVGEALAALKKSCTRRLGFADAAPVGPQGMAGTVADWRPLCAAAAAVDEREDAAARGFFEAGALDRLNLGLLWIDDPVAAFFLQVQGSGRIDLPDGRQVRVGYDGQNGWPYVAIGRVMIERGLIDRESATMPGIRAWLAAHPAETKDILDANPSYVFFREIVGDGPVGSEGVVLTPGRSLAVDTKFLPLGAPFWLEAAADDERIRRLLIAQDTGGAIRGPVRGDVFWGHGPDAERRAGTLRARGGYFLLLPKTVTPATS